MSDNDHDDKIRRVEQLTIKLLDGELDDARELAELEQLLEDEEAARVHLALMRQEAVLRGGREEVDLAERALERVRRTQTERVEAGVMARLRARVESPAWSWLGGRKFWGALAAASALAVLMAVVPAVQRAREAPEVAPQEAYLYGQTVVSPGQPSSYRVLVRDGKQAHPVAGAQVTLLVRQQGDQVLRHEARTDAHGMARVELRLPPETPDGNYRVQLVARSPLGLTEIEREIDVRRSFKLLVTTDKPIYQPGQKIRLRVMALDTTDGRPVAQQPLLLEIRDAKQNKVLKQRIATSRFGVASTDFELADQVNLGRYTILATLGDTSSQRQVTVRRYRLPRYRVELAIDRAYYAPGETVRGGLVARYTFGPPVVGARVRLEAEELVGEPKVFLRFDGVTDARGQMRFELPLKEHFVGQAMAKGDAPVSLKATVVDAAGHEVVATRDLTVSATPIRIEVIPESGALVRGVTNRLFVVTSYPDGRPAAARVQLSGGGRRQPIVVSSDGVAELDLPVPEGSYGVSVEISARDAAGLESTLERYLEVDYAEEALLLRPDRAIYRVGQSARLAVLAPGLNGPVFVDVVRGRRTALVQIVEVRQGKGELALDLSPDLAGTLQLHAYRITASGELVGDTRLIQVNRADALQINAELDRPSYRPAQRAIVKLAVQRQDGSPVQAALGLAAVDEAVFALHELRPGLAQVFFALQQDLLRPRHEIHQVLPLQPEELTSPAPSPGLQRAGQALLAGGQATLPPRSASETYENRLYFQQRRARQAVRAIAATGAVALLVLVGCVVLPLLGCSIRRSWRRPPLAGEPEQLEALGRAVRRLSLWWVLGFYLPAAVLLLMGLFFRGNAALVVALVAAVGAAILALVQQVRWVRRLRRAELSAAVPLLRRLLSALPAAFLMIAAFSVLLGLSQDYPRALPDHVAALMALGLAVGVMLLAALLPAMARSLTRPTSAARWVGGLLLRFVGVGVLPALAAMMLMVGGMRSAKMAGVAGVSPPGAKALSLESPTDATDDGGRAGRARVRRHFPETLFWRPELITDEQGRATVEIPLADSITTWRLSTSAVSAVGELGSAVASLKVMQPFFVDLDLPVAMTQNDRLQLPVAVFNYDEQKRDQTVRLALQPAPWYRLEGPRTATVRVAAGQVGVAHFTVVALRPGTHKLLVRAAGAGVADAVERPVRVEPDGERVVQTISGRLDAKGARHEVAFPADAVPGASDLLVKVYPGTFGQLVEGLDAIFQLPYGCFEQTSSTTYPNVLALGYLKRTGRIRPELELKARSYINQGYQRLLTFEVQGGGFEWFGHAPAHTVLTAYGLMEFSDMARVHSVDPDLIKRTREWLLSQQEGDGSWAPPGGGIAEGAIDRQQGERLRTTAYIAWAALESMGQQARVEGKLARAVGYIEGKLAGVRDPYTLALAANALLAAGRLQAAGRVLDTLERLKRSAERGEGIYWPSQASGVTHSAGNVLAIETTALVASALLRAERAPGTAHAALSWLVSQKDERGTWHSTQATVLALRALLAGSEEQRTGGSDRLTIRLNGRAVRTITITDETSDLFHQLSLGSALRAGTNQVALQLEGRRKPAYQVVATHYRPWPAGREPVAEQPLTIAQRFDTTQLRANDRLGAHVSLRYRGPGIAAMLIVDLGIPAGFALEQGTFDALAEQGVIERYTVAGQQVTLYIRQLRPDRPLSFVYHLRARYPVRVSAPPARAYKYYEPSVRDETRPVQLTVL